MVINNIGFRFKFFFLVLFRIWFLNLDLCGVFLNNIVLLIIEV